MENNKRINQSAYLIGESDLRDRVEKTHERAFGSLSRDRYQPLAVVGGGDRCDA